MSEIKFICNAVRWFDRVNGNTYHSCRITRVSDKAVIVAPFQYGHGAAYKQSALEVMTKAGWLPSKYNDKNKVFLYRRENGYPIEFIVSDGLKRDCIANGKL